MVVVATNGQAFDDSAPQLRGAGARRIRALQVHADLRLDVGSVPVAPMSTGEVRVRTSAAGICGSDLHAARTGAWLEYWPAILGHEISGVIIESASAEFAVGTPVVVDSRIPCRSCDDCASSPRLCSDLTWLGESRPGGFAEELVVPAGSLFPVPSDLPLDVAVLAEPLAVVLAALTGVPAGSSSVLILGYGPIGALAHLVLARRGLDVFVAEPDHDRLDVALSRGARPDDGRQRLDVVIDAAGFSGSIPRAFESVRRGGTIVVIALGGQSMGIGAQQFVEKGVTIMGTIGFDDADIPRALELLAVEPSTFGDVISDRMRLSELPLWLETPSPARGKAMVTFA